MDLDKIKKAASREAAYARPTFTQRAIADRTLLLAAVPNLLAEIERLEEAARILTAKDPS